MSPTLLYDGNCGFCKIWIDYWKQITGNRIAYATSQESASKFPQVPDDLFERAVVLVRPNGSFSSGAEAVFESLNKSGLYRMVSGLWEFVYALIAGHRNLFYQITRFTFGKKIEVDRFARIQWLFLACLGLIYASAFVSLAVQVAGLIGEKGILPARDFFASAERAYGNQAYVLAPSLFWLDSSTAALRSACWLCVGLSLVVALGVARRAFLPVLYTMYLSFSLAGQVFLGYQWDALLLEAGFLAIFFGKSERQQRIVAWLYRFLLFKLYFMSGWVKISSGDASWHDGSALLFHFETQPLPTPISWYVQHWPAAILRALTTVAVGVELLVPFLLFGPRLWRMAGATVIIVMQVAIFLTGNYTFFNLLTIAIALFAFDDRFLEGLFRLPSLPRSRPVTIRGTMGGSWLVVALTLLAGMRLYENVGGSIREPFLTVSNTLWPFQISNTYGLFAVMTKERPEIIIQGSEDGEHWQAYDFPFKPGDPSRAPRWAAPYQPRLDWQMWFAAMSNYRDNPWFGALLEKLLEGSPDVRALFAKDPFGGRPPRYIRAALYMYHFSKTGTDWWTRDVRGVYFPAVGLKSPAN